MDGRNTDANRMTHWRKEPLESLTMPSDEIVERVICECFESEEMKGYLTAHHEVLSAGDLKNIITGAMIPLSQKADLMKHVDIASYLDIKEALDALEIKPGQFFELAFEENEIRDYSVEHCSYYYRYRRFVDPPLSYPNEQHITMDELLGLTVRQLWDARALKQKIINTGSVICPSRVDISRSCFIYTVDVMRREVRSDEK